MLLINTCHDKLAATRADFSARGMLHRTCLGDAIQLWKEEASIEDVIDLDNNNELSGPNGNGESGIDLDLESDNNNNNSDGNSHDGSSDSDSSPGSVNDPPVFSEVVLAQKRGTWFNI